jgi:acid phosphatase type 7
MNRFLKISRCLAAAGALLLVFAFFVKAEVRTAAGFLPERVVLNITKSPHDSQAVTWRTREKGTAPAAQIVLLSDLLKLETGARIFNAETGRVETGDTGPAYHHAVVFESLSPDTDYAFRVGDDPHWSEWCRFTTASDGPVPFTILFFGDIQIQVQALGSQLFRTAALAVPDAAFWLFAGDMVDNGPDDREWAEFFAAMSWMARTFPLVPVPGNHEYPDPRITPPGDRQITPLWRPHFTLPDNGPPGLEETVYYFVVRLVKERHLALVMATHFPNHAFYFENAGIPVQVGFMGGRTVHLSGSPSEALTETNLARFYHVETAVISHTLPEKGQVKQIVPIKTLDTGPEAVT